MSELTFVTKYGKKNKFPQFYDRKNITITKAGKTYNVYEAIQAANEDCDIYKTLEKYGIVEPSFTDVEQFFNNKANAKAFYGDFSEFDGNMHPADFQAKAEEKWYNLPLAIRNAFGNSLEEFSKHGIEDIKKIINNTLKDELKKAKTEKAKTEKTATPSDADDKGVKDEQK